MAGVSVTFLPDGTMLDPEQSIQHEINAAVIIEDYEQAMELQKDLEKIKKDGYKLVNEPLKEIERAPIP
jgi:Skp family chaperone for outer membrane proteins